MAKSPASKTHSALSSSSTTASSTVTPSSAATSTIISSAAASSVAASSSAVSSTVASSAASAATTASANLIDNHMSAGGIAAAAILGCAVLLSCCFLGYLAFRKLQNHRQLKRIFNDQENAPLADESTAPRPMSYLEVGKLPHDDIIEIVVHQPDQPQSAKAFLQTSTPSTAGFSPRSLEEMDSPELSPSFTSPTRQSLFRDAQRHQRQSAPLLSSRLSSPLPTSPPRNPQRHSIPRRLQTLSPPLPIPQSPSPPRLFSGPTNKPSLSTSRPLPSRLHLPSRSFIQPSKSSPPGVRSLSPNSSTAHLMGHPATNGRRLSEVSPGLDPEYPYPMTPAQIGDGRPLSLLGRRSA
ncbi:hypothetical protein MMC18_000356 [Xylographa bjoerkii]|nr:hypothetical protein [Xylographa bjoerkii]